MKTAKRIAPGPRPDSEPEPENEPGPAPDRAPDGGESPGELADAASRDGVGRRELNKAQNRSAILQAALEVFTELGYEVATIRDIIRRTDLAAGTFYNYFPDKPSVFVALLNENLVKLNARLRQVRRASRDPREFVRASYESLFRFVASDRVSFELCRRNAASIRALLGDSIYGASVGELREDIEDAIARGALPAMDAAFLAGAMAGVGFEVAVLMIEREPVDIDAAVVFVSNLLLGGIPELAKNEPAPSLASRTLSEIEN